MKILKRILIGIILILLLCCGGSFLFLQSLKPTFNDQLNLQGLEQEVEVYFDNYGIPHIYANNERDAHFALGYVHAQDRLFQMEMLRRVGNGELAEILGPELAKTDRFFRTIGTRESAKKAAIAFHQLPDENPMKQAALAYYAGVNSYIQRGDKPIEFYLLGITADPFTIEDCYAIFGYMAFSFAQAFRTDPLMMRIYEKWGMDYLQDLDMHWHPGAKMIPTYPRPKNDTLISGNFSIEKLFSTLPSPPWIGSNAWVIGPEKTQNGKVLFSNDTHIAFAQPSVWYEAHLEGPDFSLYGNYLGGIPFAVTGHNRQIAWGLTMLENDDIDFYREKINPDNPSQAWFKDQWEDMSVREEVIKIKGEEDLTFEIKSTRHGPIVNEAIDHLTTGDDAISVWWVYNKFIPKNLESLYGFNHGATMEDVRPAVALGHAPGLNVMYGDAEGNIAWWAMGKLPKRPAHVNSKLFLDGASGNDEILGYFDFEDNPHSENPPAGFVYSANNQPDSSGGVLHAGYYIPENRARRILEFLDAKKKWNMADVKAMVTDVQSAIFPAVAKTLIAEMEAAKLSETEKKASDLLHEWNGDHQLKDIEPTIFYKVLAIALEKTFLDELGTEDYRAFLSTHMVKRTIPFLFENAAAHWWDDVLTEDVAETRKDIFLLAFKQGISELEERFGPDLSQWQWEKVITLEHPHALAKVPALAKIFNVGPFPVKGGNEVLNNMMFVISNSAQHMVKAGPAKRRVIDFSDLDHSYSVLPTGQSGNVLSPHYDDQAQLFVDGQFRLQMMNKAEIVETAKGKLALTPME